MREICTCVFVESLNQPDYPTGCGSMPPAPELGRGRGFPAVGTAEPRGVVGSITDFALGRSARRSGKA